ncbi:hypothetical protein ABID52_001986 [Fictibacillus halophilus]|uniref:Uncharacterized protein n=1 Tax=Fictibacillus halophilus TaxID=1610490 RepID=A0ABV2LIJ9_9BACL
MAFYALTRAIKKGGIYFIRNISMSSYILQKTKPIEKRYFARIHKFDEFLRILDNALF